MFSKIFGKSPSESIPQQLYGRLMAQAREPELFETFGVPDTVIGRFDMLALHVYLFARRLRSEESQIAVSLSQDVFDCFVSDIERALRELGIGDTTVPKRKKAMIRSFYGQIDDFDSPLADNDVLLLKERVEKRYLSDSPDGRSDLLADYIISVAEFFAKEPFETIVKGKIGLPGFKVSG